ncbi:MAG TPA: PDDEXK nuclease domain-containing protein, partial [Xanthomonadales bacterium]|nr:PDDEXK nuclease domain-containing protein [Xanthomonadales bacterium]
MPGDEAATLYERVASLIHQARRSVARGVDLIQVHTNFEIGRHLVLFEQRGQSRADYGKRLLDTLSDRLTAEFGRGFSRSNIAVMRNFYLAYQDRLPMIQTGSGQLPQREGELVSNWIVQTVSGQSAPFTLSWSHYVFLLGIGNAPERSFYEIESADQSWTVRELKRQFDSSLYERLALSRDKDGIRELARAGQLIAKPHDVLKEPLVLEFLGLAESARYSESDLETAIIGQIQQFLLELGKGFLFEARQKRFTFDADHFFVDLVFYNRLLRCYVLIDLKIGKLSHQDLGQMQMYVNYYDRCMKTADENATIGIV